MSFISNILGYVLNYIYQLVGNYGLAIIIFSVLLQLIMLPFSIKQQKTMKKSAKLQEEVKKLQVKYKNNPELLNQETMALYKENKVSPFSGCLSSIIQLILFLSVFYLVSQPLTYMLKIGNTEEGSQKLADYKQEITESGESSSYPEIKIIELKGEEDPDVYINMEFLGMDLSKVPMKNFNDWKVLIIPLLYVLTTFINIRISTNMNKNKQNNKVKQLKEKNDDGKEDSADEQLESMQQMTNSMNYMMPIFSIFIAIIAPLGLSLYWLVKNILQLGERFLITKFLIKEEDK